MPELYLALMHYPVVNKNGETIASAVTNLDLHDIARVSKTYGVRSFYVVTPLNDQQVFVERLISHWKTGAGSTYNPSRKEALNLVNIKASLDDVILDINSKELKTVVTSARKNDHSLSFNTLRNQISQNTPHLLMFGTAWGLEKGFIQEADYILDPIIGISGYNHLSVRSAVSITLDRLLGNHL